MRFAGLNVVFFSLIFIMAATLLVIIIYSVFLANPLAGLKIANITVTSNSNHAQTVFEVYLAVTTGEQERGLMYYNFTCNVAGKCINGMLFVSNTSSEQCFWMENTPEPLMQIWIGANGTITNIYYATPESTASVCHYGKLVLELNRNISGVNISAGDVLSGYT